MRAGHNATTQRRGDAITTWRRCVVATALVLSLAPVASGDLLPVPGETARLAELGRGVGVVFSPDFSVPTNRLFYERLGFRYFEDASWERIFEQVERNNAYAPRRIETLVITCHGANGHGLKLQTNKRPAAPRSYVSIGGLQERLGRAGVRRVVIAACNAGRLFRPEIYTTIDVTTRDPLFLPATKGIVNSSPGFDPAASDVAVLRRAGTLKENAMEGYAADLSPATRRALGMESGRFVVSDLFMQLLLRDPGVHLTSSGYEVKISNENPSNDRSDGIYGRFVALLDAAAARETGA
jgi:hypothetical protein